MANFPQIVRVGRWLVDPGAYLMSSREVIVTLWRFRQLCAEMTKRDLGAQFAGQMFSRFWIFFHPLLLYLIYIFLFVLVFQVKLSASDGMPRDYATYMISGLAPWMTIQQALTRSSSVFLSQANMVKQVVFPVEILPIGAVLVSFVPLLMGLLMLLVYTLANFHLPPLTYLLLPFGVTALFLFLSGIGFMLAGLTPFIRDLKDIVLVLSTIGVYLVPAFYLPQWTPDLFRPIIYANPFSYFIWVFQDMLYFGRILHPLAWVVAGVMAVVSFACGYRVFRAIRPYVANVL